MINFIKGYICKNHEVILFFACKLMFLFFLINICSQIYLDEIYFQYFGVSVVVSIVILTLQDIINVFFISRYRIVNKKHSLILFFLISVFILYCVTFALSLKTLLVLFGFLCLLIGVFFFNLERIKE